MGRIHLLLDPALPGGAGSGVFAFTLWLLGSVRPGCVFFKSASDLGASFYPPGEELSALGQMRPSLGKHLVKNSLIRVEFRLVASSTEQQDAGCSPPE